MRIEKLDGTSPRLYALVAPLVMRRSVLRQNNNYPFWTSRSHTWFVAWEGETVFGFIPVEITDGGVAKINNYYVSGDDPQLLSRFLREILPPRLYDTLHDADPPCGDIPLRRVRPDERVDAVRNDGVQQKPVAMNVYERTQQRLKTVFDLFDNIYVSFSGGKDSGVLLNLCIDYIRQHGLQRRIGVFHMDYEIQYRDTLDYVNRTLAANADILDVYRVCIPFKVQTCTSMFQQYWRPWDGSMRDIWVREMPEGSLTQHDFPFFTDEMWDYEFQNRFAEWLHRRSGAKRTCCLIGIRTQESFNRWRTIYSDRNHYRFAGKRWIRQWVGSGICNAYPLYDWLTTDVWTANGRFGWSYNRLYDLFYRAGVPLDSQRVASPFISPAIASLHLYKAIDPNTWGRMVGRVNGANFAALYGRTTAAGWQSVHLPQGMTWESYMHFLLSTLPEPIRRNYLEKLSVSIRFWRDKGGCLSDETITKLQKAGIRIEVGDRSAYRTDKRPVRMEYLDDISLPEFSHLPTFKRICICILKNDHACKYMGFAPNKNETQRRKKIMEKYESLL